MEWFRIVGTSHVASEAERLIVAAYDGFLPDAIAVELDPARLQALLAEARPNYSPSLIRRVGLRGYLFGVIGSWLQRRLGRAVNIAPGADMLAAVRVAQRHQKRLLLIDRPIQVTLHRLGKVLGWRELKRFCRDLWGGVFGNERVRFDLARVPDDALVARLLTEFRRRYPRPYRVLVEERNRHMARALRGYHAEHPYQLVLVVVGKGHEEGLRALLEAA